jgi:uncharacterized protein YgbK (DUF1537 family)
LPLRWLILADDLTGVADCAIAFTRCGRAAVVGWGEAPAPLEATVFAIDADSRRLAPAAARHRSLVEARLAPGMRLIKKIDSTLHGQPAAELRATIKALRDCSISAMAIVAPAFPATGRTTEGGRIHLDGTPLEETNGPFGHGEEEEKIIPAVQACHGRGWTVEGPLPADTLFFRAARRLRPCGCHVPRPRP